jgi:hypothetical protein
MAQKATESVLQAFLEGLREEIHASLSSTTGELISALQAREIEHARQIAARLQQEMNRCDSDRPSYFLAQIVTLLYYDDVFLHCDELSARLLALEYELQRLRVSWRPYGLFPAPASSFEDGLTVPIQESRSRKCGTPGVGKWPGEGWEY